MAIGPWAEGSSDGIQILSAFSIGDTQHIGHADRWDEVIC